MNISKTVWTYGLMIALLIGASPCQAGEEDYLTQITRANDFYNGKQYQKAVDIYESLIARGVANGYLYYNLGNTYFRLKNLSAAILNYTRAKQLIPRFEDLDANLRYALQKTPDKIMETRSSRLKDFIFWLEDFSPSEYISAVLAINLAFWLILMVWWYFRSPAFLLARNILLMVLLVTLVSAGARFYAATQTRTGVVLQKTMDVKSARGMDNVTLFQLHEGAIVGIMSQAGEWYKIELPSGKKGWAPKKAIAMS